MTDREHDDQGDAGGSYGAEYPDSTERSPGGYGEMAKGEVGAKNAADHRAPPGIGGGDRKDEIDLPALEKRSG